MSDKKRVLLFASSVFLIFFFLPYLPSVLMGGVLAIAFESLHRLLIRRKVGSSLSAALVTVLVTVGILLPLGVTTVLGVKSVVAKLGKRSFVASEFDLSDYLMNSDRFLSFVDKLGAVFPVQPESLSNTIEEATVSISLWILELVKSFLSNLPSLLGSFVMMVLAFYFCLHDRDKILRKLPSILSLQTKNWIGLSGFTHELCTSVLFASTVSALVQSLFMLLLSVSLGLEHSTFFSFSVFLMSFVPLVGATPVPLLYGAYELIFGSEIYTLLLWTGAVLMMLMDSILRPWIIGEKSHLHPFLAFVSALCGMKIFGVFGIFLGPILIGILLYWMDHTSES